MALTAGQLQTMLDALKQARYSGQRSVTYGDRSISWASDDELASKIRAIEEEIAGTTTPRRRASLASFER